jgi:hypothetical protein
LSTRKASLPGLSVSGAGNRDAAISRRNVDRDRLGQLITSGQVMYRGSTSRKRDTVGRLGRGCCGLLAFFIGSLWVCGEGDLGACRDESPSPGISAGPVFLAVGRGWLDEAQPFCATQELIGGLRADAQGISGIPAGQEELFAVAPLAEPLPSQKSPEDTATRP